MLTPTASTPATTAALPGLAGPALPDDGSTADGSDAQAFAQALDAAAQAGGGGATRSSADSGAERPTARTGLARGRALPGEGPDAMVDTRDAAAVAAAATAAAAATDAADTDRSGVTAKADAADAADADDDDTGAGAGTDLLAWLASLSLTPPAPSAATATAGLAPPSDAGANGVVAGSGRRAPAWPGRTDAMASDKVAGHRDDTTTHADGVDDPAATASDARGTQALPVAARSAAGSSPDATRAGRRAHRRR